MPGLRVKLAFYLDHCHKFSGQNEFGMNKVPGSADLCIAIEGNEKIPKRHNNYRKSH